MGPGQTPKFHKVKKSKSRDQSMKDLVDLLNVDLKEENNLESFVVTHKRPRDPNEFGQ